MADGTDGGGRMGESEVQWVHVGLAAVVVLMVLLAQSGSDWVAVGA